MDILHKIMLSISNWGFLTAWCSLLLGILISLITAKTNNRIKGTLLGFIAGLLLSVVCFDLIPEAFKEASIPLGLISMVIGLIFSAILDGQLHQRMPRCSSNKNQHLFNAAIFMTIGFAIDNFPAGIALGSLLSISIIKGLQLAAILILHGIPEGLTIGYFLKQSNKDLFTILLLSIFASFPMALGASIGSAVSKQYPRLIPITLAFASALIMYAVFRETLEEARETWSGRLSAIGNVLGMILGFITVTLIH
ncbi:MAG: ZIP family metal transporter [Bacillota bacterium]|nr:ZIP family metal transporter [Bacillota bacterium]